MQFVLPRSERLASVGKMIGGSAGSILLRGFSIVSNIAAVSLSLRLLGPERYGQYVLLMAAAGWLALGMLGTGEYFTQALVKVPGGSRDPAALPLLRANLLYCLIGAAGAAVVSVAGLFLLDRIRPVDTALVAAGAVLLVGTALSQPLSMASSALVAQGKISLDAIFKLIQPLLLLVLVAGAYLLPTIPPSLMLVLLSAAYALSWLVTRAWVFVATFDARELLSGLGTARLAPVARGAWPFLVIQLAALLSFQTDRFLVSGFSSLSELASYDLILRIFSALYTVFSIPLLYIWRLVGTSWHVRDTRQVRRVAMLYSLGATAFWIGATVVVIAGAPLAIRLFSGSSVAALPWPVTALVGAFFLVRGTTDVLTLTLYAMEQQQRLLPLIIAHGLSNVVLAAAGGALGGIEGLLIGQLASFVLSTQLPFVAILRHCLREHRA